MSKDTCSRNLSPLVSSAFAGLGKGSEITGKSIQRQNAAISTSSPRVIMQPKRDLSLFPRPSRNCNSPPITPPSPKLSPKFVHVSTYAVNPHPCSDANPVDRIANAVRTDKSNMHKARPKGERAGNQFYISYTGVSELAVDEQSRKMSTTSNTTSNVSYERRRPNVKRRVPDGGNIPPVPGIPRRFLEGKQPDAPSNPHARRFCLSSNLVELDQYNSRAPSVNSPISNDSDRLPRTRYNVLKICVVGSDGKWHYLNLTEL